MKVLITANQHRHYNRTGELVSRVVMLQGREYWRIRFEDGSITVVTDGQFREVKRQPC